MEQIFWLVPGALAGRAGPDLSPWNLASLRGGGFDAVLSVNDGAGCYPEEFAALGMSYRCIPLSDNAPPRDGDVEQCLEALPEAYAFVRGEIDRHRAVLVHCRSGKDRTGLFFCYFLVRDNGMSVGEAIAAVRRVRPIALSAEGWEDFALGLLGADGGRSPQPRFRSD